MHYHHLCSFLSTCFNINKGIENDLVYMFFRVKLMHLLNYINIPAVCVNY